MPAEQAQDDAMSNPHPKTDHLVATRWKAGESGNPAGRPKGTVGLITRVKEVLKRENEEGVCLADELAEILVKEAMKHPAKMWGFIKEFMDRDEGPPERNPEDIEGMAHAIRASMKAMDETVPRPKDCDSEEKQNNGKNGNGGV